MWETDNVQVSEDASADGPSVHSQGKKKKRPPQREAKKEDLMELNLPGGREKIRRVPRKTAKRNMILNTQNVGTAFCELGERLRRE